MWQNQARTEWCRNLTLFGHHALSKVCSYLTPLPHTAVLFVIAHIKITIIRPFKIFFLSVKTHISANIRQFFVLEHLFKQTHEKNL